MAKALTKHADDVKSDADAFRAFLASYDGLPPDDPRFNPVALAASAWDAARLALARRGAKDRCSHHGRANCYAEDCARELVASLVAKLEAKP